MKWGHLRSIREKVIDIEYKSLSPLLRKRIREKRSYNRGLKNHSAAGFIPKFSGNFS